MVGRLAALSGVYAIEHKGPQQHAYTLEEFLARYKENFGSAPGIAMPASRTTDPLVVASPFSTCRNGRRA